MAEALQKKYKILIVDDSEINRMILSEILKNDYDIIEADSGEKALELLQNEEHEFSLVLLDIVMSGIDGFEVLSYMNKYKLIEDTPVIMISAENSSDFITKAYDLGASDYVSRPFDETVVQRRVKNTIVLYAKQKRLADIVAEQVFEKEKNNNIMISILSHIVEFRNGESGLHVLHISTITELLLRQLLKKSNKYNLSMSDIRLITTASSLHDIGKIAIPDEILNKPGRFTDEEFKIMKTHSEIGSSMLKNLPVYQNEPLLKVSYEICRWHHERYNGRGYPDGLAGDEIPLSAQIVSIADVYDALVSERCYKAAYSHKEAINMILEGQCGDFNPDLLDCLVNISDDLEREILGDYSPMINESREIKTITEEIISNDDLSLSANMLQKIEFERARSNFFETELSDITFTYHNNPSVLTLSDKGAELLGLDKIITEPKNIPAVITLINETSENISACICSSTPDDPQFTVSGYIKINGTMIPCEYICRTVWLNTQPPHLNGIVGRIRLNSEYKI